MYPSQNTRCHLTSSLTICGLIGLTLCILDLANFGFMMKYSRFPPWGWSGFFEWRSMFPLAGIEGIQLFILFADCSFGQLDWIRPLFHFWHGISRQSLSNIVCPSDGRVCVDWFGVASSISSLPSWHSSSTTQSVYLPLLMRHSYGVAGNDYTYALRFSKSLTAAIKDVQIPTIILTFLFLL